MNTIPKYNILINVLKVYRINIKQHLKQFSSLDQLDFSISLNA